MAKKEIAPRKPGRPRVLPDYNPSIPRILSGKLSSLLPLAENCVKATAAGDRNHGLLWLALTNRIILLLAKSKTLEARSSLRVSEEERNAVLWAQHHGKWDWDVKA